MRVAEIQIPKKKIVAFYRLSKVDESLVSHLTRGKKREAKKEIFNSHINTQREIVTNALKHINGEIIGEFEALIQRGRVKNCYPFQLAVELAIKEKADIMVSTFDRIGDSIYFIFGIKEKLSQYGLKLIFADYLEADDMILAIKLSLSKKEKELISKRQRDKAQWVKKYGSKSGKPVGNPHFKNGKFKVEYDGYRRKGGQIKKERSLKNEHNRINSSYIIESKKAGNTFDEIAQRLNDMGRLTIKGIPFTKGNCIKLYYKFIKYYDRAFTKVA